MSSLDQVYSWTSPSTTPGSWAPAHVENVADLACRTALAYRGVAHINFPVDLQEQEVDGERSQAQYCRVIPRTVGAPCASAAGRRPIWIAPRTILNSGKKIAILVRPRRPRRHRRTWKRSRKNWRAPIIKALLGKAAVPDDSPYTTGGIGLLGTKPSQEAWKSATRC